MACRDSKGSCLLELNNANKGKFLALVNTMKAKTILQSAVDCWPEDEAYATAQAAIDRLADYPEESESSYRQEALNKDVAHMLKCFYRETDGVELAGRYLRELARLNTTGMHPTCNCTPNT